MSKNKSKLIVVNAATIAAAAGIVVPASTAGTGKPPASSSANRVMTYLPRVIASAVESGHAALKHLAEVTGPAVAQQEREGRVARSESLLAMLGSINDCLIARHNGAKNLTNAMIDEALIKAGVKEPRPIKGEPGAVGHKSGASRYIALCTFENPVLWPVKKAEALKAIKATGIQFDDKGEAYKSPFSAVSAGYAWSAVHDVWAATIRGLNQQVAPTAQPTKYERLQKQALGLSLSERQAMLAALFVTLPTPPAEAPAEAAVEAPVPVIPEAAQG